MSGVYYNEIDKNAVAWLSELIAAGHLPSGDVDTRDIRDVRPDDLRGYTHCHFFAGIGGWPLALKLAGWPEDRPVWTGSCPCQPFSSAGRRDGFADERHLWPHWFHLIEQCQPDTIFGEQVASKDGLAWLDLVSTDLEGAGYALGAVDICAAGVGAPHIRQRLYFVAERMGNTGASGLSLRERSIVVGEGWRQERGAIKQPGRASGRLADMHSDRRDQRRERLTASWHDGAIRDCAARGVDDAEHHGSHRTSRNATEPRRDGTANGILVGSSEGLRGTSTGPTNGFWRDVDWLFCRDGKWRPVEPGTFPLADGVPARVGRLRGYGNAIVIPVAQAFIETYLDIVDSNRDFVRSIGHV